MRIRAETSTCRVRINKPNANKLPSAKGSATRHKCETGEPAAFQFSTTRRQKLSQSNKVKYKNLAALYKYYFADKYDAEGS
eukprot:6181810-Pleurochrysis_carterae.AAC.1